MKTLLLALMLSALLPAQAGSTGVWILPLAPIISATDVDEGILTVHTDGLILLTSIDGEFSWSRLPGSNAQGPVVGDEPVPMLTTSWVDREGVTHTVRTPIISTTPAGLMKARALHTSLVNQLQHLWPPRPVNP